MNHLTPLSSAKILHPLIGPDRYFPNNSIYPLLIYKSVFDLDGRSVEDVQQFLKGNQWINSWLDVVYDYQHYHSNTHETLVIYTGHCQVQFGGDNGVIYEVSRGDVVIIPAGVAHKNTGSSDDFKCIGSYPFERDYDVCYGLVEEHPRVDENIAGTGLPACDPVFGTKGGLFDYWKS
ncbi:Cupin domain protein [Legionella quinlivanii]|uniref:Cupin domain protein n=1 Tax=Legionella quinlivanii TaxID=45073 RepID=A0A0W0Y7U3_9GAMM|nr:cupin domain-containing protein [Legionella quinlivanii]KTD53063.1 Cupin domain protein [Legionella quinlivanii]MCW8451359.1 cupin domain-containing protein [Legionella quinlivanii]SEG16575.1 Uncharacterized protein YjlB [Legionella quinlivanii DSM 21216]STY10443.1 Uncharacterized protein containing double-stranded beta helix domain [Legionella quinlivanii]